MAGMRLPAREGNRPEICSGRQKKLQPHEHKGCKFSHFFHNGNRDFRLLKSEAVLIFSHIYFYQYFVKN